MQKDVKGFKDLLGFWKNLEKGGEPDKGAATKKGLAGRSFEEQEEALQPGGEVEQSQVPAPAGKSEAPAKATEPTAEVEEEVEAGDEVEGTLETLEDAGELGDIEEQKEALVSLWEQAQASDDKTNEDERAVVEDMMVETGIVAVMDLELAEEEEVEEAGGEQEAAEQEAGEQEAGEQEAEDAHEAEGEQEAGGAQEVESEQEAEGVADQATEDAPAAAEEEEAEHELGEPVEGGELDEETEELRRLSAMTAIFGQADKAADGGAKTEEGPKPKSKGKGRSALRRCQMGRKSSTLPSTQGASSTW